MRQMWMQFVHLLRDIIKNLFLSLFKEISSFFLHRYYIVSKFSFVVCVISNFKYRYIIIIIAPIMEMFYFDLPFTYYKQ